MSLSSDSLLTTAKTIDARGLQITSAEAVSDSAGNYILSVTVKNFSKHDISRMKLTYHTATRDDTFGECIPSRWSGGCNYLIGIFQNIKSGQSVSVNHPITEFNSSVDVSVIVNVLAQTASDNTQLIHKAPVMIKA